MKKIINIIYKILLLHKFINSPCIKIYKFNTKILLTVVAFNNVDIIKLQYNNLKNLLKDNFDYIVINNSNNKKSSEKIFDFCKENKISYVKIPKNPLTGIRASGSHGVALNWCYKNIIKKYKPEYFGFLDHDIFPLKDTSIINNLGKGFYGVIKRRPKNYWYLWPGFSFFEYEKIKNFSINFFPYHAGDYGEIFLDTGGSNYVSIYKYIGEESITEAKSKLINKNTNKEFVKGEDSSQVFEIIDNSWLHLRQIAWRVESKNKINELEEIISSAKKFLF